MEFERYFDELSKWNGKHIRHLLEFGPYSAHLFGRPSASVDLLQISHFLHQVQRSGHGQRVLYCGFCRDQSITVGNPH